MFVFRNYTKTERKVFCILANELQLHSKTVGILGVVSRTKALSLKGTSYSGASEKMKNKTGEIRFSREAHARESTFSALHSSRVRAIYHSLLPCEFQETKTRLF